jgi:hypothetical protein
MASPQNIELRINGEIVYSSTGAKRATSTPIAPNSTSEIYSNPLSLLPGTYDEKLKQSNTYTYKDEGKAYKLEMFMSFQFKTTKLDSSGNYWNQGGSTYYLNLYLNFFKKTFEFKKVISENEYNKYKSYKPKTIEEYLNDEKIKQEFNELFEKIYNYNEATDSILPPYPKSISGGSCSRKVKKSKKNIKSKKTKIKSKSKRK